MATADTSPSPQNPSGRPQAAPEKAAAEEAAAEARFLKSFFAGLRDLGQPTMATSATAGTAKSPRGRGA
jgi:hypothetical protein